MPLTPPSPSHSANAMTPCSGNQTDDFTSVSSLNSESHDPSHDPCSPQPLSAASVAHAHNQDVVENSPMSTMTGCVSSFFCRFTALFLRAKQLKVLKCRGY